MVICFQYFMFRATKFAKGTVIIYFIHILIWEIHLMETWVFEIFSLTLEQMGVFILGSKYLPNYSILVLG